MKRFLDAEFPPRKFRFTVPLREPVVIFLNEFHRVSGAALWIAVEPLAPNVFNRKTGPSGDIATSPLNTVIGIPKKLPLPTSEVMGSVSSELSCRANVFGNDRNIELDRPDGISPLTISDRI